MKIVIHRGTHQIGGCATEISSGSDRVFIDFGSDLPGGENPSPPVPIPGLTVPDGGGGSALFFTHYHADHTGRLSEAITDIPVYMGETAREIYLAFLARTHREIPGGAGRIKPFGPLGTVRCGAIAVTPLMVDHSAFDSYMFLIEAEGRRVLYTGDFRLHGFRGGKTLPMLRKYARDIDCVICETTNLTRTGEPVRGERDLQDEARAIMRRCKYVFVLCSSTNIDRIASFYHANPRGRLFVCDGYQRDLLRLVSSRHAGKSSLYDFSRVYTYAPNLDELMEERGFCMLIRQGERFARLLDRYRGRDRVIYSMWSGYLRGDTRNEGLAEFLRREELTFLHTSGHASARDVVALCDAVKPKCGVIPIHGEEPERLAELIGGDRVFLLDDGEEFVL